METDQPTNPATTGDETENQKPEIVLRMDDDDAENVEGILRDNGIKADVIRRT